MSREEQTEIAHLRAELERSEREREAALREHDQQRAALLSMLDELEQERRHIEQGRREWLAAIDAIGDPIFLHDRECRIVRANRAYAARAGLKFKEFIGCVYWEVFPRLRPPPDECPEALGKRQETEEELRLPSGEEFVSRAFPILDADGRYLYSLRVLRDVTERRKAEAEQRMLTEALRQAAEAVVVLDRAERITYLNPAFFRLFGYAPEEILHQPVSVLGVPTQAAALQPSMVADQVRRNGQWRGEVLRLAHDGAAIPVLLSASAMHDTGGDLLGFVATYLDLRDIRQAEGRLRASEQRFRSLIEHSSDVITLFGSDGAIRFVSASVGPVLGYVPQELQDTKVFDLIHPEDRPRVRAVFAEVRAHPGQIYQVESRLRRKDGAYIHTEAVGRNLLDDPAVAGIVVNTRDITDRRAAEAALRESEERFRTMSAVAQDAILTMDHEGRIAFWNAAAERFFGYTADEALGRELHELIVPERYRADFQRGFARFRESGEGAVIGKLIEVTARHRDGHEFPVELGVSALRLADRWHAVGTLRDITERKATEDALRRSEETYRSLFENMLNGFAYCRMLFERDEPADFVYLRVNRAFETLTGLKGVAGRKVSEVIPGIRESDPELLRTYGRVARTGTPERFEVFVHGLQSWFWISVYSPERDHFVAVFDVITERKRMEAALQQSEQTLRAIVDGARDGMLVADAETRNFVTSNKAIRDMLGYRTEEIGLLGVDDIHPAADLPRVLEQFGRQARGEVGLARDLPIRRKDGSVFYADINSSRLVMDGRPCLLGMFRDVTERREAEESLRKLNRTLALLSACNSVLVRDAEEPRLVGNVCRLVVELGGYPRAWVGYPEADPERHIRIAAQRGAEEGLLESLKLSWADDERGQHPSAQVLRSGRLFVVQDVSKEPGLSPWCDRMIAHGIASLVALPLAAKGQTVGVLSILSDRVNAFDPDEIRLLTELADDLAFGIVTLRTRDAHERLQQEHVKSSERLKEALTGTIRAIALTVEKRDPYTAGHMNRVAELCVAIGRELGLDDARLEGLRLGATIHDIGKIYVPAEVLNRPGRLTEAEFGMIRSHPAVGHEIVREVRFPWPVADMILQHHERLDGSGYPAGLKDGAILLEARILAVADVVEAITAHRPYRPARGLDAALMEIEAGRGSRYDQSVADAFLRLIREKRFEFGSV